MVSARCACLAVFDPGAALFDRFGGRYLRPLAVSLASVLLAGVVGAGLGFAVLKLNEYALLPEYSLATLAWFAVLGGIVGLVSGVQFWVFAVVVFAVESAAVTSVSAAGFEFVLGRLCYSLVVLPVAAGVVVVSFLVMYAHSTLGWVVVVLTTVYLVASHALSLLRLVFGGTGPAVAP